MRLHVTRWEARDDNGLSVGWLEHCEEGWLAGVHGLGFITTATTLTKATQALKAELSARTWRESA